MKEIPQSAFDLLIKLRIHYVLCVPTKLSLGINHKQHPVAICQPERTERGGMKLCWLSKGIYREPLITRKKSVNDNFLLNFLNFQGPFKLFLK